ncbi:unnamed protein product [Closterium sp. Yama58-4]|nr:unnamed protein product [Closterium sp. Yama58-4]
MNGVALRRTNVVLQREIRVEQEELIEEQETLIDEHEPSAMEGWQEDNGRLLLIDGHPVVYRAYHQISARLHHSGYNTFAHDEDVMGTLFKSFEQIVNLLAMLPTHVALVFDHGDPTFRHESFQGYKSTRPPRPGAVARAMELMQAALRALELPSFAISGVEADDVIATLAKEALENGMKVRIASPDKDFFQLLSPNLKMLRPTQRPKRGNPRYPTSHFYTYAEEDFWRDWGDVDPPLFADVLALMGDVSDNIPGARGIGRKNAPKLVRKYGSVEQILERPEQILDKRGREAVIASRELIIQSKELVSLRMNVPHGKTWDDLRFHPPADGGVDFWKFMQTLEEDSIQMKSGIRKRLEAILLAPASPPRFQSPLRNASPDPRPASRGFGRGPAGAASSSSSSFNQLTLLASGDERSGSPAPSSSGAQFGSGAAAGGGGGGGGMGMGSRTPMTAPPATRSRMAAYSSPSPDPRYPSPGHSSGYDSESSPSVADVAAAALSDVSEEDLQTRTPVMVGKRALMGVEGMGMSGSPGFLSGFIASRPKNDRAEMLDPKFYLESFDAVRAELEQLPSDTLALQQLGMHSGRRLLQLDVITEQLATQVMNHHQKMVQGMQLVGELDRELRVVSVICRNARRHLNKAMEEVASDLVVAASVNKKKMLTSMLPVLMRMQQVVDVRGRMDACIDEGDFARALRLCSHCLVLIEQNAQLAAIRDMNISIEEWLTRVVDHVDALLFTVCKSFDSPSYAVVIDAYAVMDDAATLADKVQNFFAQSVVTCTYDTLLQFLEQAMGEDDGHRSRLAYSELCIELPDGVFRLCLLRTLRVLFDLFSSHHHMMTWRHPYVKRPNTMSMDRFPRMAAPDPVCASAPVSASSSASDLPQLARIPTPPAGLPRSSSGSAVSGGAAAAGAAGGGSAAAGGASSGAGEANGAAASEGAAAAGAEGSAGSASREGLHARRRSHSLVIEIPGGGDQLQEKAEEGDGERDNGAEPGKGQDGERKGGIEGAGGSDGQKSGAQRTEAQRSSSERTDAQVQQKTGHAALQQQRRQVRRSSSEGHNEAWSSAGAAAAAVAAAGAEALVRDGRPPIPSAGPSGTEGIAAAAVAAAAAAAAGVGGGVDERSRNRGGGADMALRTDDVMMMGSDFREGSLADLPPNVARKMRVSTTAAVCRALQKNRKAVWELAARRVGALLTAPALCSGSSQQFLQVGLGSGADGQVPIAAVCEAFTWCTRHCPVGEAFTGVEAAGLRTKMVKQSEVYFNTFHRQNLKVLKMVLERETWQRLPPETIHTLRLISLTTSSAPSPLSHHVPGAEDGSRTGDMAAPTTRDHPHAPTHQPHHLLRSLPSFPSRASSGGEGAKERRDFREWLDRGNPFAAVEAGEEEAAEGREGGERAEGGERSSSGSGGGTVGREGGAGAGSGDAAASASGAAAGAREGGEASSREQSGNPQGRILPGGRAESDRASRGDRNQPSARGGGARGRLSADGEGVGEGEEDEDEREELMADYIDEEEVGVSAAVLAGRGRRSSEAGGGNVGGGGGLDTGLALTGAALTVVRLMDRYTRLMGLLPPIASGIFAGLCQLFDLYLVTVFRLFGSPDAVSTLRSSDPAAAALLTPKLRTTLARVAQGLDDARNKPISSLSPTGTPPATGAAAAAALGEAAAAAAAAAVEAVGDMLRQSKPRFQSLLAPPSWTNMDVFYARTLDAVPDLWEHVLRTLVKLLLNIAGTADRIAAVNWEPADIGTQHNIYVENLVAEFRLFAHRLGQSGAPRQVQDQLVAYGLDELCDVMLDGICRVKKCNSNGRALMSLDLQVLVQGLQPIVGRGAVKGLQLVDNYIKAFYLSESQIIDWVRAHPEYTKAQVIALVVMAANGGNWKLKNKFEIIKKIDTGDLT